MSTEHPPEGAGRPTRRGASVDLDPTGIVTGKSADAPLYAAGHTDVRVREGAH